MFQHHGYRSDARIRLRRTPLRPARVQPSRGARTHGFSSWKRASAVHYPRRTGGRTGKT